MTTVNFFKNFLYYPIYEERFKDEMIPYKFNFSDIHRNVHYMIIQIYNHFPGGVRNLTLCKIRKMDFLYLSIKAFCTVEDIWEYKGRFDLFKLCSDVFLLSVQNFIITNNVLSQIRKFS